MRSTTQFPYVPCPTLDQQYNQRAIGPTPFASAKSSNGDYEVPSVLLVKRDHDTEGEHRNRGMFRMNYPSSASGCRQGGVKGLSVPRSQDNVFQTAQDSSLTSATSATLSSRNGNDAVVITAGSFEGPNASWQAPPPFFYNRKHPLHATGSHQQPLPRDTLHPLISALQAGENAKAAAQNPKVAYLANASRTGPPCEAHLLKDDSGAVDVRRDTSSTNGLGADDDEEEDDDAAMQYLTSKNKRGQVPRRGDLRTFVGRNYSTEGCFHEPDTYGSSIVEVSSTQPSTLTAKAAKALAEALHGKANHAIPSNVQRSAQYRGLPNSTAQGHNRNQHRYAALNDPDNPALPPTQAFRNLPVGIREALLLRERDCRHRVYQLLKEQYCVLQPPPLVVEGADEAMVQKAMQELQAQQLRRSGASAPSRTSPTTTTTVVADPEERDDHSDSEYSPFSTSGEASCLNLWVSAVKQLTARRETAADLIPVEGHPAKDTVLTRRLRVITPQLISLHHGVSSTLQAETVLNGVGIALGNTLSQIKPPSVSSFLQASKTELVSAVSQYSDIAKTPANVFGFDSERLTTLLSDRGEEVEQIFLEGCAWLSAAPLRSIGRYCVNLTLLHLQDCAQVTDELMIGIFQRSSHLSYLNISGCVMLSGASLAVLFDQCPDLTVLCASRLPLLDEDAELAFAGMHRTTHLRVLDLSYCENVTDVALTSTAQYCRSLECLDVSGCRRLSDIALASIGGSCPYLRRLSVKLCTQLTIAGLSRMCIACRHLESLDLTGLSSLTPPVFELILSGVPHLKRLSISGCLALDDTAVNCITRSLKRLESLDVSSCEGISMASCMSLVHELTKLRWLVVSESSISNAEVVMLCALRESCKIVRNQLRAPPKPPIIAYRQADAKKKKSAAAGAAKGGKKK